MSKKKAKLKTKSKLLKKLAKKHGWTVHEIKMWDRPASDMRGVPAFATPRTAEQISTKVDPNKNIKDVAWLVKDMMDMYVSDDFMHMLVNEIERELKVRRDQ